MKLSVSAAPGDGGVDGKIAGAIDENALPQLEKLAKDIGTPGLVRLDLGKLESLNSHGTAHWVKFLGLIPTATKIELHDAPECFVSYCKLIAQVLGRATLASVHVAYECAKCEHRAGYTLKLAGFDKNGAWPARACPGCSAPAAQFRPLDDPDEYLSFLP